MRKLRVGLIGGGGPGSFFGRVHWRSMSLDGSRHLVAGALRSSPEAAMASADEFDVCGYPTYEAMLDACAKGDLQLDYVTVATPNNAHYGPAKAFLEAGIPVLCEKPVSMTVEEAEELDRIARREDIPFVLAHTYTGHPMLMTAREMIRAGAIGEVRKVEAWYRQGWLADPIEEEVQQAQWRTDPQRAGMSCCGGDIGSHAFIAATWVTGLDVSRVSARLSTFVAGRVLDDDFNVMAEMSNGATGIITATQIAVGYKNDNGIRVFGSRGSLEWHQERAEKLLVRRGEADEVYWTGANYSFTPEPVKPYLRVPAGHMEDFFPALANLHLTMELAIRRRRGEEVPAPYPHPGTREGVAEMKFVAAAIKSSESDGTWLAI
mgnify:CR=1 FL=1